jgi:hypothetical protein
MLSQGATAHALAQAAQELGQADDITALCIERIGVMDLSGERAAADAVPVAP